MVIGRAHTLALCRTPVLRRRCPGQRRAHQKRRRDRLRTLPVRRSSPLKRTLDARGGAMPSTPSPEHHPERHRNRRHALGIDRPLVRLDVLHAPSAKVRCRPIRSVGPAPPSTPRLRIDTLPGRTGTEDAWLPPPSSCSRSARRACRPVELPKGDARIEGGRLPRHRLRRGVLSRKGCRGWCGLHAYLPSMGSIR